MKKDIRITIRIDDQTYLDLISLEEKHDRTISWLVRTAIKRFIHSSKRKGFRL